MRACIRNRVALTPVTTPPDETLAMAVFNDAHVTVRPRYPLGSASPPVGGYALGSTLMCGGTGGRVKAPRTI